MAGRSPPAARKRRNSDKSPAGAPPDQRTLNRPWRIWATIAVVGALFVGAFLGFVVVPAGQRENAGLSLGHAMERAAGLEAGSPAVAQPQGRATAFPVSTVSWDPAIMQIL